MPTPTFEEFKAAAQKVREAHPNASFEEFSGLIKQQLGGGGGNPQPISADEPDTYWGGVAKSLKHSILDSTVNNPMLQSAAHPQTAGDFLSLVLPSGIPHPHVAGTDLVLGGKTAREFADRSVQAMKAAGSETKGLSGLTSFPFRAVSKFKDALPSSNEAAILKMRGVPSASPSGPVTAKLSSGGDLVDEMLATEKAQRAAEGSKLVDDTLNKSGMSKQPQIPARVSIHSGGSDRVDEMLGAERAQRGVEGAKAAESGDKMVDDMLNKTGMSRQQQTPATVTTQPASQDVWDTALDGARKQRNAPKSNVVLTDKDLNQTLQELLAEDAKAQSVSLPPEQTITAGGSTRQTGKFKRSDSLGQAGGYTSGRPATPPDVPASSGVETPLSATVGPVEGSRPPDTSVSPRTGGVADLPSASDRIRSTDPVVEDWHSGTEPGSPEARSAQLLHQEDTLRNQRYKQATEVERGGELLSDEDIRVLLNMMRGKP